VRGGRLGTYVHFGLASGYVLSEFVHDGPNTVLIEQYLGPQSAEWHRYYTYNARIQIGSVYWSADPITPNLLVFRPHLKDIMRMLPSNQARRQVLACLADPGNYARVHQGMLLTCVWAFGFPPGYDAQTWWERHRGLFRSYHDPHEAATLVLGWIQTARSLAPEYDPRLEQSMPWLGVLERQRMAALRQERPSFCSDAPFAKAYADLSLDWQEEPMFPDNVAWWPECPAEPSKAGSAASDNAEIRGMDSI